MNALTSGQGFMFVSIDRGLAHDPLGGCAGQAGGSFTTGDRASRRADLLTINLRDFV